MKYKYLILLTEKWFIYSHKSDIVVASVVNNQHNIIFKNIVNKFMNQGYRYMWNLYQKV